MSKRIENDNSEEAAVNQNSATSDRLRMEALSSTGGLGFGFDFAGQVKAAGSKVQDILGNMAITDGSRFLT